MVEPGISKTLQNTFKWYLSLFGEVVSALLGIWNNLKFKSTKQNLDSRQHSCHMYMNTLKVNEQKKTGN